MNTDYSKMTNFELLEERRKIDESIKTYSDREKVNAFKVFENFEGTKYFLNKSNASAYAIELIEISENFVEMSLSECKLTQSEVENWCVDFAS